MVVQRIVLWGSLALALAPLQGAGQSSPALPGPCVPIPADSWEIMVFRDNGSASTTRLRYAFTTERDHDIDGDGTPDAFVPLPRERVPQSTCPVGLRRDVYVVRGSCGHRVGQVHGRPTSVGPIDPATGLATIATHVDVMSGGEAELDLRYTFDPASAAYAESSRHEHRARCLVHPADCDPPIHSRCELRGHPTIRSYPDSDAISALLHDAAREAQSRCKAPNLPVERCDVEPRWRPNGTLRSLRVRDCPRRRRCVAPIFRAIRIPPWTGRYEPLQSTSFQIPRP
ncbi:MAG: hypothetical protein JJ863_36020 [Deltaproteobacteria bacterium]|nr:hypothetical protein [Deltaproteobacteria bacterium]